MGKFVWIFAAVFGLAGLGMLIGSGWTLGNTLKFRKVAGVAEGTVVELLGSRDSKGKTSYKPVVEFTDTSGTSRRITGSVASRPAAYDEGEKVKVRFDPAKPDQARLDTFMENWFLPLLLGGMGLIFFGVGVGMTIKGIRTVQNRRWLRANGMRVQAQYTGTEQDTTFAVNKQHPWVVCCRWQHPVTGATHEFKSDHRWYDPSGVMTRDTIDVVVNADDPSVYEVDISFLPKKV